EVLRESGPRLDPRGGGDHLEPGDERLAIGAGRRVLEEPRGLGELRRRITARRGGTDCEHAMACGRAPAGEDERRARLEEAPRRRERRLDVARSEEREREQRVRLDEKSAIASAVDKLPEESRGAAIVALRERFERALEHRRPGVRRPPRHEGA